MTAGRFTADQIRAIRASTERPCDLAEQLGVSAALICKIRKGKAYGSVTDTCDGVKHRGLQGKLSEDDVRAIRASHRTGKELAYQYGMRPATISMIRSRKSYAWVTDGD